MANNYDWTSPQNDRLWQDGAKTLFDPCPAGWRVPKGGLGTESPWSAFTKENGPSQGTGILAGRLFGTSVVHGGTGWYPVPGFRDLGNNGRDGQLTLTNQIVHYLSSSAVGSKCYNFYFYLSAGIFATDDKTDRGHGLSVRCLRE